MWTGIFHRQFEEIKPIAVALYTQHVSNLLFGCRKGYNYISVALNDQELSTLFGTL